MPAEHEERILPAIVAALVVLALALAFLPLSRGLSEQNSQNSPVDEALLSSSL